MEALKNRISSGSLSLGFQGRREKTSKAEDEERVGEVELIDSGVIRLSVTKSEHISRKEGEKGIQS